MDVGYPRLKYLESRFDYGAAELIWMSDIKYLQSFKVSQDGCVAAPTHEDNKFKSADIIGYIVSS